MPCLDMVGGLSSRALSVLLGLAKTTLRVGGGEQGLYDF